MLSIDTNTSPIYGKLKKYYGRKKYQRLYPDYGNTNSYDEAILLSSRKKKYSKVARFGGGVTDHHQIVRQSLRLRVSPKLKLKKLLVTPVRRLLAKIRNGYVNVMLGLAGNAGTMSGTGNSLFGGKRVPKARQIEEKKNKKKVSNSDMEIFETKLVYEIYKVLAASRQASKHLQQEV